MTDYSLLDSTEGFRRVPVLVQTDNLVHQTIPKRGFWQTKYECPGNPRPWVRRRQLSFRLTVTNNKKIGSIHIQCSRERVLAAFLRETTLIQPMSTPEVPKSDDNAGRVSPTLQRSGRSLRVVFPPKRSKKILSLGSLLSANRGRNAQKREGTGGAQVGNHL